MNAQLTEIMRLITNLIRTGVVTEVDRENWLCRVKTGELETNWISWLTLRAGNARTWWRPSEGEQVVLLSLGGNLETAFALPAIYSNQFAPPSTSADACVTVLIHLKYEKTGRTLDYSGSDGIRFGGACKPVAQILVVNQ
ncbi:TPA: phage baseplate assembly protein V [Escherichia coli]